MPPHPTVHLPLYQATNLSSHLAALVLQNLQSPLHRQSAFNRLSSLCVDRPFLRQIRLSLAPRLSSPHLHSLVLHCYIQSMTIILLLVLLRLPPHHCPIGRGLIRSIDPKVNRAQPPQAHLLLVYRLDTQLFLYLLVVDLRPSTPMEVKVPP